MYIVYSFLFPCSLSLQVYYYPMATRKEMGERWGRGGGGWVETIIPLSQDGDDNLLARILIFQVLYGIRREYMQISAGL